MPAVSNPPALVEAVRRWAAGQSDLRGVALVGSHARGTATPESDIDLVLVVDDVRSRLRSPDWVSDFAEVGAVTREDWGLIRSLRVRYRDGPEVEFGLTSLAWVTPPLDPGTTSVIRDGFQILFDADGLLATAERAAEQAD